MKILRLMSLVLFGTQFIMISDFTKASDEPEKQWPKECQKVEITSTADQSKQSAYFFKARSSNPRPLVVKLHAWSADYTKVDDIASMCIKEDYNYIHPDFRGPNNRPEACASDLVLQDIEDAIDYAIAHSNVDTTSIHIIGGSGGGHATMFCYMRIRHHIKTFTAWASISDLVDYYYECAGRRTKYAKYMQDLEQVTSGLPKDGFVPYFDVHEACRRSPVMMDTPVKERENSKLFIYAGIHDGGLEGDVPFTHSMKFFNKVVSDFDCSDTKTRFSNEEMLRLMEWQTTGAPANKKHLVVLIQRHYLDKVQINLFEGGHEMIMDRALDGVKGQNILVLGDTNETMEGNWVNQLKEKRFQDFICNASVVNNTIGFDNNGKQESNTLSCIDQYMNKADKVLNGLNKIFIMLGTEDCKAVFKDRLKLVSNNMKTLIGKIKAHPVYLKYHPEIVIMTPPPYSSDSKIPEAYTGGSKRVSWLATQIKNISVAEGCRCIDAYTELLPVWDKMSTDGIHLNELGQQLVADMIIKEVLQ